MIKTNFWVKSASKKTNEGTVQNRWVPCRLKFTKFVLIILLLRENGRSVLKIDNLTNIQYSFIKFMKGDLVSFLRLFYAKDAYKLPKMLSHINIWLFWVTLSADFNKFWGSFNNNSLRSRPHHSFYWSLSYFIMSMDKGSNNGVGWPA